MLLPEYHEMMGNTLKLMKRLRKMQRWQWTGNQIKAYQKCIRDFESLIKNHVFLGTILTFEHFQKELVYYGNNVNPVGYKLYWQQTQFLEKKYKLAHENFIASHQDLYPKITAKFQLLTVTSETQPWGDRYRYIVYLLRNDLIDRAAFMELYKTGWPENFQQAPPKFIITSHTMNPLVEKLHEVKHALNHTYRLAAQFGKINIYVHQNL